jgi:hypothetical protein
MTANGVAQSVSPDPSTNQPVARHVKYFSLEHRKADEMDSADRELLRARAKEISIAAALYGYDLSDGRWTTDQAICPALPGTMMVHYLSTRPDQSESLFTALVPEDKGRVRIVPALYGNAAPYAPAVGNPKNFALFNELVPADVAAQDASPGGKWLVLGVCYAEMVGSRPNVPDEPDLDIAMVRAPVSTLRMDETTGGQQVQFPDREGANVFKIWTVSLDRRGRVTGAANEDYATYVAHAVNLDAPAGQVKPEPPELPSRIMNPTEPPKVKVTNPPAPQPQQ